MSSAVTAPDHAERVAAALERIAGALEAMAVGERTFRADGSVQAAPQPREKADGESFECRHGRRGCWGGVAKSGRVLALHDSTPEDDPPEFKSPPKGGHWTRDDAVAAARAWAEQCLAGVGADGAVEAEALPF